MYMPASAMPPTPRQISAGGRPSLRAMPNARQRTQCAAGEKDRSGWNPIGKRNQWQHGRHVTGGHHADEPASLGVAQRPRHDELRQQSWDQRKAGQAQDFRSTDECDGVRMLGRECSAVAAQREPGRVYSPPPCRSPRPIRAHQPPSLSKVRLRSPRHTNSSYDLKQTRAPITPYRPMATIHTAQQDVIAALGPNSRANVQAFGGRIPPGAFHQAR